MNRALLIRADASTEIGAGHVMRTFALGQAWQRRGGRVVYAAASMPPSLAEQLASTGFSLEHINSPSGSPADCRETLSIAAANHVPGLVADGYCFGADWQKSIKETGLPLTILDDYGHADYYWADLIVNQNLEADPALYHHRNSGTRLLLGTSYTLLREEFTAHDPKLRQAPAIARRILVTLGGSDGENVSAKVVQALTAGMSSDIEVRLIVGGSNPHREMLRSMIASVDYPCELFVDAKRMSEHMAWAELAVSAAGSTAWELAFMSVPMILIVTSENQRAIGRRLAEAEAAVDLGAFGMLRQETIAAEVAGLCASGEKRRSLIQNARKLCDGQGAMRVAAAIDELCK